MKKLFLLAALVSCTLLSAVLPEEQIIASSPGGAFLVGEKISFTNNGKQDFAFDVIAFPDKNIPCSGTIQPGKTVTLKTLPPGYYCLQDKSNAEFAVRFAVVSDPAKKPCNPESFFALDGALSSLVPEKNEQLAIELARRSGTRFIRERGPRFGRVEKEKDIIDYSEPLRQIGGFNKAGIQVLSMYHAAPAWSRPERPDEKLPDDLFALYHFSRRTAAKFKDYCPAFEFWNETDYMTPISAWDFASALKAASLGYKAGFPGAKVMNGGFAINAGEQKYHHILMENDIANYLDIISLHCYGGISQYKGIMRRNFAFLDKYNANHLDIWYTETGCRAEGKGHKPFRDSKRLKEHSFSQEMLVSEFLVKQMTTAQYYGVDRNFFFSIYPCNESNGAKVWGLTRYQTLQVKAGYTAFSTLNKTLSYAVPQGKINDLPENTTGFLYKQKDNSYTALVWAISKNDTREHEEDIPYDNNKKPFTLPVKILAAKSIFGTPIEVKNNSIALGRLPVYLTVSKPLPCTALPGGRKPAGPAKKLDKSIVYQVVFSPALEIGQESGPWKSRPSQIARFKAEQARLRLYVYNFSNEIKTGTVKLSGCRVNGLPDEAFSIEPMSKKCFVLILAPEKKKGTVQITGKFGNLETGKLSFPFTAEKISNAAMPLYLAADAPKWTKMSSGVCTVSDDKANWSLKVRSVFGEKTKDKWCHPFISPNIPNVPGGKLSLEFAVDSNIAEISSARVVIYYNDSGRQDFQFALPEKAGSFKRLNFTLSRKPNAKKITKISVGANIKGRELEYRVRDLKIIPEK